MIAIPADEADVEAEIKSRGWQGQVWRLHRCMDIPSITGSVAAFCGIARPDQFFQGLESAGVKLAARTAFPTTTAIRRAISTDIATGPVKAGASVLLTTEKDRVRLGPLAATLPASLRLQTAQLRIEIEDEDTVLDWLTSRLTSPRAHAS